MSRHAIVEYLNKSDEDLTNTIYCLIFENNKIYIGQSTRKLKDRISEHKLIKPSSKNLRDRAINKYQTFFVDVLEICKDVDELNIKEQYYIKQYQTNNPDIGYNGDEGGKNKYFTEQHKTNIGRSKKGRRQSEQQIKNCRDAKIGVSHSVEWNKNISKGLIGYKRSEEEKRKNSESNKLYWSTHIQPVCVKCMSIPDNIIFDSISKCRDYYKVDIYKFIDTGRVHKKSGQTFIRLKDL